MKNGKPNNYEARTHVGSVELRQNQDSGGATIRGVAAVFDTMSENLGGFREVIAPGAFDDTDMSDVRGLFNHDSNFVLGRTRSNTLRLKVTERGLEYEIDAPETQTIRDLVMEPLKRGDITQSSFGFIVGRGNDQWDEDEEGRIVRTINRINELFDVSPVTFPAYRDTDAGAASLRDWRSQQNELQEALAKEANERQRRLDQIEFDHYLKEMP